MRRRLPPAAVALTALAVAFAALAVAGCGGGSASAGGYHAAARTACLQEKHRVQALPALQRSRHLTVAELLSRAETYRHDYLLALGRLHPPAARTAGLRQLIGLIATTPLSESSQTAAQQQAAQIAAAERAAGLTGC